MYNNKKYFSFDGLSIVLDLVISFFSLLAICGKTSIIQVLNLPDGMQSFVVHVNKLFSTLQCSMLIPASGTLVLQYWDLIDD